MKTIVVYQSNTGFTKQYAEWIAEELVCKSVSLKDVSKNNIKENELVVFGGWVMGGMISGLNKMKAKNPKNMVVFAVGSTPENLFDLEKMKADNKVDESPLFYMIGGFKFNKLNIFVRGMLKILKKSIQKKENKTPQEQYMVEKIGTSFDASDKKQIDKLVNYVHTLG